MYKKYKIAFVSNSSWALFNFRLNVIKKLREEGFEIILLGPKDNYSVKLEMEGFKFLPYRLNNYSVNPIKEVDSIFQLYGIYKKIKPDFIFHYAIKPNVYGTLAAAWLRIPSIAISVGLGVLSNDESIFLSKITHYLYKVPGMFSKELWTLNQSDKDFFTNKLKVPLEKTYILASEGIDINRFKLSPSIANKNKTKFIYYGRLLWAKGLMELSEAAKIVKEIYPDAIFQLLGFIDPTNPNSISNKQIKEWENSGLFEYLGETEDVIPFLKEADCVILPSYSEGLSRILLEAAAMGKFIITTNIVGCREIVEEGVTGFLCEPKSSADLKDTILRFMHLEEEERRNMGIRAREKVVKEFDEEIVFRQYLNTIKKYLDIT